MFLGNVLDLTEPAVRQALEIKVSDLIAPDHGGQAYLVPQKIGVWAKEQGYKAILSPSAQNSRGAPNLISFEPLSRR